MKTAMSLFSGCGGDTMGMERCGIRVVAFTEKDPLIQKTHMANFPESRRIEDGDMTRIPDEAFLRYRDQIDMIFAGFPCQGFSNAGKKREDDDRNSLFLQFVRCVNLVRPRIIMGENVKGLLSRSNKDKRPYIDIIRDAFEGIGYRIAYRVYGCEKLIPQQRQRLIIVGVRTDDPYNPVYLLPEIPNDLPDKDMRLILKYSSDGEAILGEHDVDDEIPEDAYIVQQPGDDHRATTEPPHPYLLLKKNARGTVYGGKTYQRGLLSFGKRISPVHAEIIDPSNPTKTIICTYDHQPRLFVAQKKADGRRTIRPLTVGELKQIQGFPEEFVLMGSRSQRIRMIGNAVPPPLVSFVVNHIRSIIGSPTHEYAGFSRQQLFERVATLFSERLSGCTTIKRSGGNTQEMEKQYNGVFVSVLAELGLRYTRAGTQQPVDYMIHHPSDEKQDVPIELKRTSTNKIMCNDTYPKDDVYYIILHEKKGVRWCTGADLLQSVDPGMKEEYLSRLETLRTEFTRSGNVAMYARPNFSVCITHLFA